MLGIGVGLFGGVNEVCGLLYFVFNFGWCDIFVGVLLGEKLCGIMFVDVFLFI